MGAAPGKVNLGVGKAAVKFNIPRWKQWIGYSI
jgi:hypothetical protein